MEGRLVGLPDPRLEVRYDCLYILKSSLSQEECAEAVEGFRNIIPEHGGEILGVTNMGLRRLAYEIDDETDGVYVDMVFWGKEALLELNRRLGIDSRVVRHIAVRETRRQYNARIRTPEAPEKPETLAAPDEEIEGGASITDSVPAPEADLEPEAAPEVEADEAPESEPEEDDGDDEGDEPDEPDEAPDAEPGADDVDDEDEQ
jgi:small subunit ribosomal protein S6